MAGTIVADTLQDGAGNSTAMDNAIYGSAKAWANIDANGTILGSYNISSVTLVQAGIWKIIMTNAMPDSYYAYIGAPTTITTSGTENVYFANTSSGTNAAVASPTTTTFFYKTVIGSSNTSFRHSIAVFR